MAKILVADPENSLTELYRIILEERKHQVFIMEDGESLLASYPSIKPDMVILEVKLPGKMNGFEVCDRIRKRFESSHVGIMFVSSRDDEKDVLQGFKSGADDYLLKPLRQGEFIVKLEHLAGKYLKQNTSLKPGTEFANRYKILNQLGKGGDSVVYHSLDNMTGLEVAVKITNQQADDNNFMARFLREAYGLSRLCHPNIVNLIDFGNQANLYYIVTQFIQGNSLGHIIKQGALDEKSAIGIAIEIGKALVNINKHGVVHRDIKPDNILISDDGDVVLVDFGLAREEHQQTLSLKDEMFGTPQYLSPEYIKGSKVDIRTDIYSLGITLFYAITGELPFQGPNAIAVMHKQLNEDPPSLKSSRFSVSPDIAALVDKMLLKDPEERCSLDELIENLDKIHQRLMRDGGGEAGMEGVKTDTVPLRFTPSNPPSEEPIKLEEES